MNDNLESFEFVHRFVDGSTTIFSFQVEEPSWDEVLDKFVGFLEQIYGYNIKDKIETKTILSSSGWT